MESQETQRIQDLPGQTLKIRDHFSPFGPGLAALVVHLHVTQAISFERLVRLMDEVFGVALSEGAIANMLARAEAPMIVAAETIAEAVRSSPVVASDETSARVKGKTWWQWVLLSSTAIYHVIVDSRGAKVVADFLQGAVPEVWVADRYAAQNGHGRRRERLEDSTLAQYRADLDRRLTRMLGHPPTAPAGRTLARAIRKCRDDLFIFVTRRDVPYTNNGSERALRPSVIFRKVTGGFRSDWGARLYAAAASVIATGKLNGKSALQALQNVITPDHKPIAASWGREQLPRRNCAL